MNKIEIPIKEDSGKILLSKIKIQENKLKSQISSIHAEQLATNLFHTSSNIYQNAAFNSDIINKDIDKKIVISQLPDQIKEIKSDLKEILNNGLPYKEFVEYRGLLKMLDKYESKFTDSFSKNAFLINDISNFSENVIRKISSDKPQRYSNLTEYAHALSPTEKMAFNISTLSSNMLTKIEHSAGNIQDSIKNGVLNISERSLEVKDKYVKLYTDTKNGINVTVHSISDTIKEKIGETRDIGLKVLNKTKDLFLGIAKKGLIATFAGYHLGKMLVEEKAIDIKNNIDKKFEVTNQFKDFLIEKSNKGFDKIEGFVNDKIDSTLYNFISAKAFTKAVGMEISSGVNKIGQAIKQSGNNIIENKEKIMDSKPINVRKRNTI